MIHIMTNLLIIKSSPSGADSLSNLLVSEFVAKYQAKHGDATIVERDLSSHPLPYVDATRLTVINGGKTENLTSEEQTVLQLNKDLIEEYTTADIVVIGSPVYNFTIPAQLKTWIDSTITIGKTTEYGPNGPQALLPPKKIVVLYSSATGYETLSKYNIDFIRTYLSAVFQTYFGVSDVHYVEIMARNDESKIHAFSRIKEVVNTLAIHI